ncbi:hypothetical protein [Thalassospira sp.]|uniref:PseG/SpsG family protein n=1 Tax=Thalassospira sp. TaxID=1912094 RepID=UPI001B0C0040|nr:hypothetical protein [Thalassospira sp.]MBO6805974.1 glycosyltransferase [Thalassospira sp.]
MKSVKLYIRTVADAVSGMGHLSRMLTFAKYFRAAGYESVFGGDRYSPSALENITSMGFKSGEASSNCTIVVYDLVDTVWREQKNALFREIEQHRNLGRAVVFFDGRGEISYRKCYDAVKVDYLVAPYVGELKTIPLSSTKFLLGPDYFPLAENFVCNPQKEIRESTRRILLTAGGSDPYNASRMLLNATLIADPQGSAEINVVIGSMFSERLRQELHRVAGDTSHRVLLHECITDLSDLMAVADLCVCANGLTKYELAAMGVPTIVVSINEQNHEINQEFSKSGAVIVAGILDALSVNALAATIVELMNDRGKRLLLSQAARQLIDGNGLSRIRTVIGL